jgi:uncharacterized protein YrrD
MLVAGSRIINSPIMGLQTGSELARVNDPIIDPNNLQIIAYSISGPLLDTHPSFLRVPDVREFSDIGVIVDSSDEFVTTGDIIKLDEIVSLHFDPINMSVIDEKKHKLGKVIGYTIDTVGFMIQQLNVKRPLFKSFNDTELLIHRSQIIEINDKAIIVHSEAKVPDPIFSADKSAYINPFRKQPQTEQSRQDQS